MNLKLIFPGLFISVLALNACNKTENEVTYVYHETWCANPWKDNSNFTQEEKEQVILDYLGTKKIDVASIWFVADTLDVFHCEACTCLSGVHVFIIVKNRDSKRVEALDFQKVNE